MYQVYGLYCAYMSVSMKNAIQLKRAEPVLRFDREAWLQAAMDVLAQEGQAKLRIENLVKKLGVTRGSFYHHFESKDAFVRAIVDYWAKTFTEQVNARFKDLDLPASEKLLLLMQMIDREGLDRYDIAFRSWAAQEPTVAEVVRKVDLLRFEFVKQLFAEMGFKDTELSDRVQLFLVFVSSQRTIHVPEDATADPDKIVRLHALFTQPGPDSSTHN